MINVSGPKANEMVARLEYWRGTGERISPMELQGPYDFCGSRSRDLEGMVWDMKNYLPLISRAPGIALEYYPVEILM